MDDQVSVALPPEVIEDALVDNVTVGSGVGVVTVMVTLWFTEPVVLVQVKV